MLVLNMPVLQTAGRSLQRPPSASSVLDYKSLRVHRPLTGCCTNKKPRCIHRLLSQRRLPLALPETYIPIPPQKAAKPFFPPVPAGMTRSTLKRTVLDSGLRSRSTHL